LHSDCSLSGDFFVVLSDDLVDNGFMLHILRTD